IVGSERGYPRYLDWNELAVHLYLRRPSGRENQIADFVGGTQHCPPQSGRSHFAAAGIVFQRNRNCGDARRCHSHLVLNLILRELLTPQEGRNRSISSPNIYYFTAMTEER